MSESERINPVLAFLLMFPASLLVFPYLIHFWYVTQHQNRSLRAAGRPGLALANASAPALG